MFPDVFAYGILLVPKDLQPGERRPVVVCQHGLEGRPQEVVTGEHRAYHDFAARLAERGFVTFAPQNLYIFQDAFRTLQRKANPLKKTLFSLIALGIFGVLLFGRVRWGWRGRTALRLTVSGFVVLLLAYVGSRFVLEVILGR